MFDFITGLFRSKKNQSPLERYTLDELRALRVDREMKRDKLVKDVRVKEEQKAQLFQQGTEQADRRSKRITAQRILDAEEEVKQLDAHLASLELEIRVIGRIEFIKRNATRLAESKLDKVLGAMDTGELVRYLDDMSTVGAVDRTRLEELSQILDEAVNSTFAEGESEDVTRLVEEMERAALQSSQIDINPQGQTQSLPQVNLTSQPVVPPDAEPRTEDVSSHLS